MVNYYFLLYETSLQLKYTMVFILKQYYCFAKEITDRNFLQITIALEEISQGMSAQGQCITIHYAQILQDCTV